MKTVISVYLEGKEPIRTALPPGQASHIQPDQNGMLRFPDRSNTWYGFNTQSDYFLYWKIEELE